MLKTDPNAVEECFEYQELFGPDACKDATSLGTSNDLISIVTDYLALQSMMKNFMSDLPDSTLKTELYAADNLRKKLQFLIKAFRANIVNIEGAKSMGKLDYVSDFEKTEKRHQPQVPKVVKKAEDRRGNIAPQASGQRNLQANNRPHQMNQTFVTAAPNPGQANQRIQQQAGNRQAQMNRTFVSVPNPGQVNQINQRQARSAGPPPGNVFRLKPQQAPRNIQPQMNQTITTAVQNPDQVDQINQARSEGPLIENVFRQNNQQQAPSNRQPQMNRSIATAAQNPGQNNQRIQRQARSAGPPPGNVFRLKNPQNQQQNAPRENEQAQQSPDVSGSPVNRVERTIYLEQSPPATRSAQRSNVVNRSAANPQILDEPPLEPDNDIQVIRSDDNQSEVAAVELWNSILEDLSTSFNSHFTPNGASSR